MHHAAKSRHDSAESGTESPSCLSRDSSNVRYWLDTQIAIGDQRPVPNTSVSEATRSPRPTVHESGRKHHNSTCRLNRVQRLQDRPAGCYHVVYQEDAGSGQKGRPLDHLLLAMHLGLFANREPHLLGVGGHGDRESEGICAHRQSSDSIELRVLLRRELEKGVRHLMKSRGGCDGPFPIDVVVRLESGRQREGHLTTFISPARNQGNDRILKVSQCHRLPLGPRTGGYCRMSPGVLGQVRHGEATAR